MFSPFGCTFEQEIDRRCIARYVAPLVEQAATALGAAIDAGLLTLDQALDLVRSCNTADELGDALTMLAATVPAEGGA